MAITKSPYISIIIPTRGRAEEIREWLSHIYKLDYKKLEVVIIDNNEDDELYQYIIKKYPQVSIIKPKQNIGITTSFYLGAKNARGEILHFSNDDVFYEKNYFNKIIAELEKYDKIGVIGGTMLDKENNIIQGPSIKNFELVYYVPKGMRKKFANYRKIKGAFDTANIGGGQLTIRKEVLEECGNWDPDLFMYSEEIDLIMKVRKKGYTVKYVPQAVCYHFHVMQARDVNRALFYMCRNKLVVIRRYFNTSQQFFYLLMNFLFYFPRMVFFRMIKPKRWLEIKFIISGIKAGMSYFKTQRLEKIRIEIAKKRIPRIKGLGVSHD